MPRSQRPRKKHQKKNVDMHSIFIRKDEYERIQALFVDIQLFVEIKLPRGTLSMSDVQKMRDTMNFATMLIWAGHRFDAEKFERDNGIEWKKFIDAFHSFYERAMTRGIFTATGDELNTLRDGFEVAGKVIKEELEQEPKWCLKVFDHMKRLTD